MPGRLLMRLFVGAALRGRPVRNQGCMFNDGVATECRPYNRAVSFFRLGSESVGPGYQRAKLPHVVLGDCFVWIKLSGMTLSEGG